MPTPVSLNIDASTHCQLQCATCPTASGSTKEGIGSGHLSASDFERFVERNPSVLHVELANWGEVLLNPELVEIMKIAFDRDVALTVSNGMNLNHARPEVLEALVKYRVLCITAAIDGATQQTYAAYRIRGDLDRVLQNIRCLNDFKQEYRSCFPVLIWQFVAFGHNEHEIEDARALAESLGMHFYVKLAWDDFSPAQDKPTIRSVTRGGTASRREYLEKHGEEYLQKALCRQMWNNVQINFDGEVLGCCANRWGSLGNAFEDGLEQVLEGEKMSYARQMLMGRAEPRDDMPCIHCDLYRSMQQRGDFMRPEDLTDPVRKHLHTARFRFFGRRIVRFLNRSKTTTRLVSAIAEAAVARTLKRPV